MSDPARSAAVPRVYAVVLNHRHSRDALRAVASLFESTPRPSIVVVDNGSPPRQLEVLRSGLPADVSFVESGENLGYAGGNNLGIAVALRAGADFVWILNADVVVEPEALGLLLATAASHPQAGIIGSRVLHGRGEEIWFNGGAIVWSRGGATRHLGMGKADTEVPALGPSVVDYITGAAMLVRSEVFADAGLLPEDYFLYFEETDFSVRARLVGWWAMLEPRSRVRHFKRSSGALPQPYFVYYFIRNRIVFGTRYTGWPAARIVADQQRFIESWRRRVKERAPEWLPVYERLVQMAIEDGTAGRVGRRKEIEEVPGPSDH